MTTVIFFILAIFILYGYAAYAYVCAALGQFRMMRAVDMKHVWMAWVPMCNIFALGELADHYNAVKEGKTTRYRQRLPAWYIVSLLLSSLLTLVAMLVSMAVMAESLHTLVDLIRFASTDFNWDVLAPLLAALAVALLIFAVFHTVYLVHYYVVLHKIYKLFAPERAKGWTVLSILLPVVIPALFLAVSKRRPVYTDSPA